MLQATQSALETELDEIERQASTIGEQGQRILEEVTQTRVQMAQLVNDQENAFITFAQTEDDTRQVNDLIQSLESVVLDIKENDSKEGLDQKLERAKEELDEILSQARQAMPSANLANLEDEIAFKKVMFESAVDQNKQEQAIQQQKDLEKSSLCHELTILSPIILQTTQNLHTYLEEKQTLQGALKRIENDMMLLPSDAKSSVQPLLNQKRQTIEKAISDKALAQPMANLLANLDKRYKAIGGAIDLQSKRMRSEASGSRYALFNTKSSDKANAIQGALYQIALKCGGVQHSDISNKSQSEKNDWIKNIRETTEFKLALLDAWDNKTSDLYLALNTKRMSFFDHSLTFFSGQSWSHCIDGDSATVKAIKAVDAVSNDQVSHQGCKYIHHTSSWGYI